MTVTPAANQTGVATITVTVSDGSLTAQDTFVQTVTGAATFALSGTVRGTGNVALAGASVHVFSATGGTYLTSVLTSGSGGYAFNLAAGSYKLLIQASGYPDQWHGGASYAAATTITLGPSQTVDISLSP